jgi:hypothetical protein
MKINCGYFSTLYKSDEEPAEILSERTHNPFRPLGNIIMNQRIPQKKRYCELMMMPTNH